MSYSEALPLLNRRGLHARASAKLVRACEDRNVTITVGKGSAEVDGKSIMGLLMLGAAQGDVITLSVEGVESEEVFTAIKAMIADKFGEGE